MTLKNAMSASKLILIKKKLKKNYRSKNIITCSSMFFLNQEINPAMTSNLESKSKPRIKEHEHQRTWTSNQQEKKKKHEHHQIKEHQQE